MRSKIGILLSFLLHLWFTATMSSPLQCDRLTAMQCKDQLSGIFHEAFLKAAAGFGQSWCNIFLDFARTDLLTETNTREERLDIAKFIDRFETLKLQMSAEQSNEATLISSIKAAMNDETAGRPKRGYEDLSQISLETTLLKNMRNLELAIAYIWNVLYQGLRDEDFEKWPQYKQLQEKLQLTLSLDEPIDTSPDRMRAPFADILKFFDLHQWEFLGI